jgi:hypothetical protein
LGKHSGPAFASTDVRETDDTQLAHSVCRDLSELVALFDRQLGSLPVAACETRSHLAKAKAAAERGLRLSRDLIQALRR